MTQDQIQTEIVKKALKFFEKEKYGYIDGAMRLGKMKITIDILSQISPTCDPPYILIAYPDNKLKEGWMNEFVKWGYDNPHIILTNFSSLHKYLEFKPFFFIIDEFHSCSPLERDYCHQIMTNKNPYVLGLSGTISKETKEEWGLKEIAKYTTLDAIADKVIADYKISVHFVELDKKILSPNKKGKMLSEKQMYDNYTFVINNFKRDGKDAMFLALARNRLSTSSLGKINYAKDLLQKLKDKRVVVFAGLTDTADSLEIPSYHNKSKNDDNFKNFQAKKFNHLALANMGKMGLSYTDLDCVILLNATGNPEETSQIINRAIKLDYQGKIADTHIIALNEDAEKKKMNKSLSMLDKAKIVYKYVGK